MQKNDIEMLSENPLKLEREKTTFNCRVGILSNKEFPNASGKLMKSTKVFDPKFFL